MSVAEKKILVLKKAASLLIEKGWSRGHFQDEQGRYCAIGAIDAAFDDLALVEYVNSNSDEWNEWNKAYPERELRETIHGYVPPCEDCGLTHGGGIPAWNDAQESPAPVLKAFEDTIARLEKV